MRIRRRALGVVVPAIGALVLATAVTGAASNGHASKHLRFTATYVSTTLGGGEPFVIYSHKGNDLVFSSHEGTTLTYRYGLGGTDSLCNVTNGAPSGFLCSYKNQINVWHSSDNGKTWQVSSVNPVATGFSDPSLTEDESGLIYDTGINLVNDALFSSSDGGKTFPRGTPQCHNGDRPWLAGGAPGEVFLATDTTEGPGNGHVMFRSKNGGASCESTGIADNGAYGTGTFSGFGQILYDHQDGSLTEPADFMDSSGKIVGVGISRLANATTASFAPTTTAKFVPSPATLQTSQLAHWPAIAIDRAGTTYVVWDTQPRDPKSQTGCTGSSPNSQGAPALLPNSVMLAYTRDHGKTWSKPLVVAHPGTTVLWPWITAGSAGKVAVVWDQANQLTDPDCDSGAKLPNHGPTRWTVQSAVILDATQSSSYPAKSTSTIPSSKAHPGGVFHVGNICQGGTTCVVEGQDRRLGDYLTDAIDQNGCVMIATGDTMMADSITGGPLTTSRPLFIHEVGGPSLINGKRCTSS